MTSAASICNTVRSAAEPYAGAAYVAFEHQAPGSFDIAQPKDLDAVLRLYLTSSAQIRLYRLSKSPTFMVISGPSFRRILSPSFPATLRPVHAPSGLDDTPCSALLTCEGARKPYATAADLHHFILEILSATNVTDLSWDHRKAHKRYLSACSLVSVEWANVCRAKLFSDLRIDSAQELTRLRTLMTQNMAGRVALSPHYIRVLRINQDITSPTWFHHVRTFLDLLMPNVLPYSSSNVSKVKIYLNISGHPAISIRTSTRSPLYLRFPQSPSSRLCGQCDFLSLSNLRFANCNVVLSNFLCDVYFHWHLPIVLRLENITWDSMTLPTFIRVPVRPVHITTHNCTDDLIMAIITLDKSCEIHGRTRWLAFGMEVYEALRALLGWFWPEWMKPRQDTTSISLQTYIDDDTCYIKGSLCFYDLHIPGLDYGATLESFPGIMHAYDNLSTTEIQHTPLESVQVHMPSTNALKLVADGMDLQPFIAALEGLRHYRWPTTIDFDMREGLELFLDRLSSDTVRRLEDMVTLRYYCEGDGYTVWQSQVST
ncbi:hypothetical protein BC629DRAFT_1592170 [Irpex lacteus]|nr:hypothetical protein BC629DRAFT_1592170 [Irpex lacteus]